MEEAGLVSDWGVRIGWWEAGELVLSLFCWCCCAGSAAVLVEAGGLRAPHQAQPPRTDLKNQHQALLIIN